MDNQTYLQESARTVSDAFHVDVIEEFFSDRPGETLGAIFGSVLMAGQVCDSVKAALFYGRQIDEEKGLAEFKSTVERIKSGALDNLDSKNKDLIHTVLGLVSEAAELMDAILRPHEDIDMVNVREELGDILWYTALGLRASGGTFDEAMERNIAKLKHRFPEKFSQEAEQNRDLEGERKILE